MNDSVDEQVEKYKYSKMMNQDFDMNMERQENGINLHDYALEDSLTPLGPRFSLTSSENNYVKSGSSVLVPLADQDSLFSPNKSDQEKEQNEKATIIQRKYREKLQRRKEEHEQNEKAAVIQRKYREKLQKRKEAEEENQKATIIQRRYREKLQKRKEEEEEEQNEKAAMIQRMYRAKRKKKQLQDERKGELIN